MTPDAWLLFTAAVVVLLLAAWVAWTLTRLSRLEARVDRAWSALDTQAASSRTTTAAVRSSQASGVTTGQASAAPTVAGPTGSVRPPGR